MRQLHSFIRLFAIAACFVFLAAGSHAQTIQYTKHGVSPTGLAGDAVYSGVNPDSVWTVLKSSGTISGVPVYKAQMVVDGRVTGRYEQSREVKQAYVIANAISGASVTSGVAKVPLNSGVVTVRDTVGIVDADTAAHDLIKFTVPANTWKDGQIMRLYATVYMANDSNGHNSYMRSAMTFTGDGGYTFDSSQVFQSSEGACPLEFDFQRVGTDIYCMPSMWLSETSNFMGLDHHNRTLGNLQYDYFAQDLTAFGHGNGHKFTNADFTHDITIGWNAQLINPAGDVFPNSVLKVIAGGVHVITLQ